MADATRVKALLSLPSNGTGTGSGSKAKIKQECSSNLEIQDHTELHETLSLKNKQTIKKKPGDCSSGHGQTSLAACICAS